MRAERQGQTKGKFYILSTHCTAMQKGQASEPVSKIAHLLNQNQISELIMDSNSDKSLCDVAAVEDEEHCAEVLLETHLRSQSKYTACSRAQSTLSLDSTSISEEDDVHSAPDPQTQTHQKRSAHCPLTFSRVQR